MRSFADSWGLVRTEAAAIYAIHIEYQVGLDRTSRWVAVHLSSFQILAAGKPVVRFEYDRKKTTVPAAHIHVHGSNLLSIGLVKNYQRSLFRCVDI